MDVSVDESRKDQATGAIENRARGRRGATADVRDFFSIDRNIGIRCDGLIGDNGSQDNSVEHPSLVGLLKCARPNRLDYDISTYRRLSRCTGLAFSG